MNKLTTNSALATFFLCFSSVSSAALIYDEISDGDAGIWWDSSASLGTVSSGDYVMGHAANPTDAPVDWDGYDFTLDGSIDTIKITKFNSPYQFTANSSSWQLFEADSYGNTSYSNVIFNQQFSFYTITLDVTGLSGLFKLGNSQFTVGDIYDYKIAFSGSEVSEVPIPTAAFLFAPAMLGFIGLRRKSRQA
jgi:hypothetical protein